MPQRRKNPKSKFPRFRNVTLEQVRAQFPVGRIISPRTNPKEKIPEIFMDSGGTTRKAQFVLKAVEKANKTLANVHRGVSDASRRTTHQFEKARSAALSFIKGQKEGNSIIFVNNNTHGLNLVAHLMKSFPGITLTSEMEHHSNILPYKKREFYTVNKSGGIDYKNLEQKLKASAGKIKLVAITGASNVTGYMPDIHRVARLAHKYGALIVVDAAQLAAHAPIDVKPNSSPSHIDFLVVGGHKGYTTGSGFVFAPTKISDSAKPFMPGGGTVHAVTKKDVLYKKGPDRHEGGTQDILGAIGLRTVLVAGRRYGMEKVRAHEIPLIKMAMGGLKKIPGVKVYGNFGAEKRVAAISFDIKGMDYQRLAEEINKEAIQIRSGCFCAHPYVAKLKNVPEAQQAEWVKIFARGGQPKVAGLVRVTFGVYTTPEEVKRLIQVVEKIAEKHRK
jgi:selenocysteine lyase/cysteine desulfurase